MHVRRICALRSSRRLTGKVNVASEANQAYHKPNVDILWYAGTGLVVRSSAYAARDVYLSRSGGKRVVTEDAEWEEKLKVGVVQ